MNDYLTKLLSIEDRLLVQRLVGWREPDLVISPDGKPYLLRWHVIPRNEERNVYLHVQVADDQDRALHDHPWDNTSIILAGGYHEHTGSGRGTDAILLRKPGDIIHRQAEDLHRLVLMNDYSISLFLTGPRRRDWGFQFPDGWVSHTEVTLKDGGDTSKMRR